MSEPRGEATGRESDPLPLEPEAPAPPREPGPGAARIDRPSLLSDEGERCPRCGAELPGGAVVCTACGYDLLANEVRRPEVGVAEVAEDEVFVEPGRGPARALAWAGLAFTVAAMIAAGFGVPAGGSWTLVLGNVVLAAYNVALHTGTGFLAVLIAARLTEQRFGREGAAELATARVFAAYALFEFVRRIPVSETLGPAAAVWLLVMLKWAAAAGLYWLAVWVLFNKGRTAAGLVVLAHALLWVAVVLGMELAAHVSAAMAAPVAAR